MKLILASKSPRRAEILKNIGVEFEIRFADVAEIVPAGITPEETVKFLSNLKAKALESTLSPDEIIIAADTLVFYDDKSLGKPADKDDAFIMLKKLSGKKHSVFTGITIVSKEKAVCDCVKTDVYFKKLSDREITSYINTSEPLDKAGSYGIQGMGGIFVEKIDGDYFSVVGLPICRLCEILSNEFGFNIFG